MASIELWVAGLPIAQGSKTFVPTPAGPRSKESNEKTLRPWRNDIRVAATIRMNGPPWIGPVSLRAVFVFPRPKSHYGTGRNAGQVKDSAPGWKTSAPDLDKLIRAVGDSLTGLVYRDDSQIVDLAVTKIYGQTPGLTLRLSEV
jgi:crossover junction endodeoxyribonuclease RusA